ncbi:hypothetical protein IE53DRAFT_272369 [Violaceomyces palustris]|uniref:Uncharacterized protein n=1 Tax=Violaceomyces palustris TaxID=1673888 RepID=A0ACD0NMS1_9BASI|nr:hypothetical protein IE53DRAFT_272369 [Violaceomyces palustris]
MGERLNGLGLRSRVARSLSLKRKTSVSSPASTPKTDKSQQKDSHRASCSLQENPSLPPLPPLPLGTTTVSAETAALPEQPRSSTSSSSSRTSSTPRGSGNVLGGMRSSSPLSTPPINAEATSATPAPPSHPTHKKGQRSHDVCSSIKPASNLNGHPLRPSRSDESLVTEPRRPTVPPRLQSTARGAPIGPPLPLMPSPPSYSLSPPPGSSLRMPPQAERREDPLQNVHDHMRAREDLLGHGPFFTVQRGWKKGVYTSREEADKQIRNLLPRRGLGSEPTRFLLLGSFAHRPTGTWAASLQASRTRN